jgi:hypothetical protein
VTWRRRTVLVGLVITVLTLASCGGHGSASTTMSTAQQDGTVVGVYGIEGGPAPGLYHPFSNGSITLMNRTHHYSGHISVDGHFRLTAAPGTYDVTGFTDAVGTGTCGSATARVQANQTTSISVTCQIP